MPVKKQTICRVLMNSVRAEDEYLFNRVRIVRCLDVMIANEQAVSGLNIGVALYTRALSATMLFVIQPMIGSFAFPFLVMKTSCASATASMAALTS